MLGEGRAVAERGTLPVDDVDGDDEHQGDAEEDGGGLLEVLPAADVGVERGGGDGQDPGEKVAGPAVATGCGGGVGPVGSNHVVDCGHVDCVVGDANDGCEDHGADPLW